MMTFTNKWYSYEWTVLELYCILPSQIRYTNDTRRITAAEMKYMRRTAGYTWKDYKTNAQIAKELKITPILDKLLEYKRIWIRHVDRISRNRLPRVMKYYSPSGRRNHGRPLKRFLDTWDRNGSKSGPTPWQIYDDDDYNDIVDKEYKKKFIRKIVCRYLLILLPMIGVTDTRLLFVL